MNHRFDGQKMSLSDLKESGCEPKSSCTEGNPH